MEYSDWLKYNEEPEYTCPMCGTEVRRLADKQIEYLKKQGNVSDIFFDDSGELKRDEDKRNRVKQLQYEKEMNEILSTNQEGENDAVNARLQTR